MEVGRSWEGAAAEMMYDGVEESSAREGGMFGNFGFLHRDGITLCDGINSNQPRRR